MPVLPLVIQVEEVEGGAEAGAVHLAAQLEREAALHAPARHEGPVDGALAVGDLMPPAEAWEKGAAEAARALVGDAAEAEEAVAGLEVRGRHRQEGDAPEFEPSALRLPQQFAVLLPGRPQFVEVHLVVGRRVEARGDASVERDQGAVRLLGD